MDKEIIVEIKQLFETAEDYCKSVEVVFSKGLVVPAINELRYCGKHLLDACTGDEEQENLRRAKSHCQRAIYDAAEAAALASIQAFDDFKSRFCNVQICDVVNNYQDICKAFQDLKKCTSERIEDERKPGRYELLMNLSRNAMAHLDTLNSMEEELKKARHVQERKYAIEIKHLWIGGIGLFLTGIGVAAALL